MRRTAWTSGVLIAAVACTCARADDASGLMVRVVTDSGGVEEGRLRSAALDGEVVLARAGGGDDGRWPARSVISIRRTDSYEQPVRPMPVWLLADGDRLIGSVVSSVGDRVSLHAETLGTSIDVELSAIAGVIMPVGRAPERKQAVRGMLTSDTGVSDRLLLSNGDDLSGIVAAIDAGSVELDIDGAVRTVAWDQIAAARLVAETAPPRAGTRALVRLLDGDVLTTDDLRVLPGEPIAIRYRGSMVTVDPSAVSAIELRGDHLVDLADLDPSGIEETPLLNLAWGVARNANTGNGPLAVSGVAFHRGMGVHGPCVLRYSLSGGYRGLITSLGLDDSAGPLAAVEVRIRVDGADRYRARVSAGSAAFDPIFVDLTDAQTLELVVEPGRNGPIQDRFDWLDPVLIR